MVRACHNMHAMWTLFKKCTFKITDPTSNSYLSLGFPLAMLLVLLEKAQGLLTHNKVCMGVVAVVVLYRD